VIPVLVLIILHSGTGTPIELNTATVTHLRNPEPSNPAFTPNVRCQVNMTDGKYVTVLEKCEEVRRLMEATK